MSTLWDYWVGLLALVTNGLGQHPLVGAVVAAILILTPFAVREEMKR